MNNKLTNKQYNIIIGIMLFWGLFINTIMSMFSQDIFCNLNPTTFSIIFLVVASTGLIISKLSNNTIIKFIGYNLLVFPIGIELSIQLKDYHISFIIAVLAITIIVTIVMFIISQANSKIFSSIQNTMYYFSISGILILTGFNIVSKWWILCIILLFCGYIGCSWNYLQSKDKLLKNVINSVVSLYINIVILELLIFNIMK